jgi:hypothetical protein
VPNLPAGTVFKVEERYNEIPSGYGLDRYKHIEGHTESEYGEITKVNSYNLIDKNVENIGVVIPSQDPKMEVRNKKGYGINVRKKWRKKLNVKLKKRKKRLNVKLKRQKKKPNV